MRAGGAVVDVQHAHTGDDGEGHQHHGEHQVFSNERHIQWGRRNDLWDQKQEDGESQEDGDAEGHLLPTVWRQVEDQDGQRGDQNTRNDEVYRVEEGFPLDDEVIGQVHVGGI